MRCGVGVVEAPALGMTTMIEKHALLANALLPHNSPGCLTRSDNMATLATLPSSLTAARCSRAASDASANAGRKQLVRATPDAHRTGSGGDVPGGGRWLTCATAPPSTGNSAPQAEEGGVAGENAAAPPRCWRRGAARSAACLACAAAIHASSNLPSYAFYYATALPFSPDSPYGFGHGRRQGHRT